MCDKRGHTRHPDSGERIVVDGRESRGPSSLFIRGDTAIFCAALTITLLLFELPDSDYSMIHSIIHTLYIDLDQFTNYRVNVFFQSRSIFTTSNSPSVQAI